MSRSIEWYPVVPPPPLGGVVDYGLASMLACWRDYPWDRSDIGQLEDVELGAEARTWLEGVCAATSEGEVRDAATELIEAIKKHGQVRLKVVR